MLTRISYALPELKFSHLTLKNELVSMPGRFGGGTAQRSPSRREAGLTRLYLYRNEGIDAVGGGGGGGGAPSNKRLPDFALAHSPTYTTTVINSQRCRFLEDSRGVGTANSLEIHF